MKFTETKPGRETETKPNIRRVKGAEAMILSLLEEGVNQVFGYPGGAIMPVYDSLYGYRNSIEHLLVRHEQGAVHAAQGYARATGKTGVVFVTSGPGATNLITGISDDSTRSIRFGYTFGASAGQRIGISGQDQCQFKRVSFIHYRSGSY